MKHSLTVTKDFSVTTTLGPLVVTSMTGAPETIDGPRVIESKYKAGTKVSFATKKAAMDFLATHAGKVDA